MGTPPTVSEDFKGTPPIVSEDFKGTPPMVSKEFERSFKGVHWNSSCMNQSPLKELLQRVSNKFSTTLPSWEYKIEKKSKCPFTGNKSLSSKVHNFLIRCLLEVSYFGMWRAQGGDYSERQSST
jgi:hypothetical protein